MTAPQNDVRVLERHTITAPLGVRFWDVAERQFVRSGLRVTAYDASDTRRWWRALENSSGVSVLRDLRGLREIEQSGGGPAAWADALTPPRIRRFQLELRDPSSRFLPFTWVSDAPQRSFAAWLCPPLSPPATQRETDTPDRSLPVFPTPSRPVPGGFAVVRTQLVEPDLSPPASPPAEGQPRYASWAFVEVWGEDLLESPPAHPRPLGASYADEKGRVAVMFPWPAPVRSSLLAPPSPPGGSGGLLAQRWRIRLEAYYDGLDPDSVPDLCAVLSQRRAALWDQPGVPMPVRELEYGRELVVRSEGPAVGRMSELLITPGP